MGPFIARVIDVNDPEYAGRVRIRVFGDHDDIDSLPDSDLPWARCVFPVTNPISSGIAGPTTGMVANTIVFGMYLDEDKQLPIIQGTMGRASQSNQQLYGPSQKSDFPPSNIGNDTNPILNKSIVTIERDNLKSALDKTIADIKFSGQSVIDLLQQVDKSASDVGALMSKVNDSIDEFNAVKNEVASGSPGSLNGILGNYLGSIGNLPTDVSSIISSVTGDNGDNIATVTANTVTSVSSQVDPETSVIYSTSNQVVGNISTRMSKAPINSTEDAINRINGSRFIMATMMSSIESTLNQLKSVAKKKNG